MDFVIIANAWQDSFSNPTSKHHIALELVRAGHRVVWVNGTGMRRPSIGSGHDRRRGLRKICDFLKGMEDVVVSGGEISVISPLAIPLPGSRLAQWINSRAYLAAINRACRTARFESPVLVTFLPITPGVLADWPGLSVYYCVDRWDAFDSYDNQTMAQLDMRSCRVADIVIASSMDLSERCSRYNSHVRLIRHGVAFTHFARSIDQGRFQRPSDIPDGSIVGFIGLISGWVDQDLLVELANRMPETNIVLIGDADVPLDRIRSVQNIHVLGSRPFMELPDYMSCFDVGIIPFVVDNLTRAVNPLKLREMMAAGCPVVSTDLPEVDEYARSVSGVRTGKDKEQFISLVRDCLDHPPTEEERRLLSQNVASETWVDKVAEMVGYMQECSARSRSAAHSGKKE